MSNKKLRRFLLRDQIKPGAHIAVFDLQTSANCPLHWHNYIELELVTGGTGYEQLNGQNIPLSRGSLSLLRLTDFHEVTPDGTLSILKMIIDDSLLAEDLLSEITARQATFSQLSEQETATLERLLRLCLEEEGVATPDQRYLKHLLICVLLRVLRLLPENEKSTPSGERPIQTALLYLHMHFRENPGLKDVAKIAHYNASHFSTTFHKELGMTYSEYLNMLKITYAKELLLSTDLKITEVCYECGFTSHSNFLRLFREQTGLSPMQFRKKSHLVRYPNPIKKGS